MSRVTSSHFRAFAVVSPPLLMDWLAPRLARNTSRPMRSVSYRRSAVVRIPPSQLVTAASFLAYSSA
jgi:hypothetical protein